MTLLSSLIVSFFGVLGVYWLGVALMRAHHHLEHKVDRFHPKLNPILTFLALVAAASAFTAVLCVIHPH